MSDDAAIDRLIRSIRRNGITDETVLAALASVPRDRFVPPELRAFAWHDYPLPIGHDQTISQPLVVAYMTERLEVLPTHRVLEIGTGSGYQAAVLARLGCPVYTIERRPPLLVEARGRFAELGLSGIATRLGDGTEGWPDEAPFDRILVTAAAEGGEPPPALLAQLAVGGVLVIPLGEGRHEQRLVRIRRNETGFQREALWSVRFVPLVADVPGGPGVTPAA